jgi:hypothetical protein
MKSVVSSAASRVGAKGRREGFPRRLLRIMFRVGRWVGSVLLIGWASLAIFYSNLPWPTTPRAVLAVAFAIFGIWALLVDRGRGAVWTFAVAFLAIAIWWSTIRPSADREWRADVAVMPRATIDGDRVTITGVRNFHYRDVDDFEPRYETREFSLANVTGVDFYVSYWMPGPIGHTFLSFDFKDAPPLSISIEARPEAHEGYAPVASLFKQFELIYVVGDERDLVGVRTNYRHEDVYLYRIHTTHEGARELLLTYLRRINELAERPEFYHLLSNNCTINIVRYSNAIAGQRTRFDIRHYLNGLIEGYLYDTDRLRTTLPLAEFRRRSHINAAAQAADSNEDFSQRIRAAVPAP